MNSKRLSVGDCGDEVRRLHERLVAHGLEIAPQERKRGYFGPSTRAVVGDFQRAHGVHLSYEVCQRTLAALTSSPAVGEVAPSCVSTAPGLIARTGSASCKVREDYTAFQTTDGTESVAYTLSLANNAATHLDVLVIAINSDKTAGGSFKRSADFRNNDGTAAQINATRDCGSNVDAGLIWQCTIDCSGSRARVLVTGAAGSTVRWGIYVSVMETTPNAVLLQPVTIDPLSLSTPVMVIDAETGVYPAVDDGEIDSVTNQAPAYSTGVQFRGINRAGAEYGNGWNGWFRQPYYTWPNTNGGPNATGSPAMWAKELNYYASKGFNHIRLPISWERLQHSLNGDFNRTYQKALVECVTQATNRGFHVIVVVHNYNRYATDSHKTDQGPDLNEYPTVHIFNKGTLTTDHLVDLWTKLSNLFKSNNKVIFELMNEPHDFPMIATDWFEAQNRVIEAIRDTGATNMILSSNSRGSDVDHWQYYPPNNPPNTELDSEAALKIRDRGSNHVYAQHAYWKHPLVDGDPATPGRYKSYVELLTETTEWAKQHSKKMWLTEMGAHVGTAADAEEQINEALTFMNENRDVWIGWTPWNLNPFFLTDPSNKDDGSQMPWYTPFLTPDIIDQARVLVANIAGAHPLWQSADMKGSTLHSLKFDQDNLFFPEAQALSGGASHFVTFKHTAIDAVSSQRVNAPMTLFGYNADPQVWSAGFSAGTARYVYGSSFPVCPYAGYPKGTKFTVSSNGGTQTDWVLVPKAYNHEKPTPLLVWLHGCGGKSEFDVNMVSFGGDQSWISLAVGGREKKDECWGALATDGPRVLAAIDYIRSRFNIDPSKIVLGGYSSGGDLGYALAFQNSDLFSGVIFENTAPGSNNAMSLAKTATNKFHIAQMVHTDDTTYRPRDVLPKMNTLREELGFQVEIFDGKTVLQKNGKHWDQNDADSYDSPSTCTSAHLRTFMLPFLDDADWVKPGSVSTPTNYDSTATNLNDGKIHTVCWTHSLAGVLKVYVDSVPDKSWTAVKYNSRAQLNIIGGGYLNADCYEGSVAEAMSYNGVLTDQNVKDLHFRAIEKWF